MLDARSVRQPLAIWALACVVSILAAIGIVLSQFRPAPQGLRNSQLSGRLGVYAGAIRAADGELRIRETLEAVENSDAERYYYLIRDRMTRTSGADSSSRDWDLLPEFARQAEERNIEVVVYLVPPSESRATTYAPYGWDYVQWAKEVQRLAEVHKNISGMAIDDFAANADGRGVSSGMEFSPEYTQRVRSALRFGNDRLKLFTVLYGQDFVGRTAIYSRYREFIDGVIYPFSGPGQLEHIPQNTTDPRGVKETASKIASITGCSEAPSCWQLSLPQPTDVREARHGTSGIRLKRILATGKNRIQFQWADSRVTLPQDTYSLNVTVDGKSYRASAERELYGVPGWKEYEFIVPGLEQGEISTIEISLSAPAQTRMVTTIVSNISINEHETGPTEWSGFSEGRAVANLVHANELILMLYAARFGIEKDVSAASTPEYFSSVLGESEELVSEGQVDGLVAYQVNLKGLQESAYDGPPENREVLARTYRRIREAS